MSSQISLAQTRRRSNRLALLLTSHKPNESPPSPSVLYDLDRPVSQSEIGHFSSNASIAELPDNLISFDQQLPLQSQLPINYAERFSESIPHVNPILSSNLVLPREPSTNQTPPIGTGSPSYAHHGNDALAEGNVELFGEGVTFPESTFDCSIFSHVTLARDRARNNHLWAFDMIGSQFAYKEGEIDDLESNPSNLWMIIQIILGEEDANGDVVIPSSTSSVYRDNQLYFLVYSFDRPSVYELFPVKSFNPNLSERRKFFKFVADSRGNPIPPPLLPPQPFLNDGHVHYMQGVNDSDPIADLSPSQLGVLLTFEPANAGYIMDKFVLHNMQKALLHCLQKMNNSSADSLINKRFSNLFHVLPFLFLQTGSFDKNRLRERSEKFKNLIMEDKTDDILVGDVKKKTSTAHSILKKKFNLQDRQHKEADRQAKAHDFGKALAALQKKDLLINPENLLNAAKESLPQRKTDSLSPEDREQLFTRVDTEVAASLANVKSLEKCLYRLKRNRAPGVDGLSVEHLITLFYTGNGSKVIKDQLVKEYVILLQKFLTGNLSSHQAEVFYSLKLAGIPKDSTDCRVIMMVGLHSKVAFALVSSSKFKKKVQNEVFGKNQTGAMNAGGECLIHAAQAILSEHTNWDVVSADGIKAFYNMNRDLALDTLKKAFPEVFNMFLQKYNNNANAFISGMREGVLNLQQSEGGSPGSPEMSFLYELSISPFIKNIEELCSVTNASITNDGIVMSYIDDLYWGAPFDKMVEIIEFVQINGPKYGYTLNMHKCVYLFAADVSLDHSELNRRLDVIMQLGFLRSNIKIHPNTQQDISRELYQSRSEQWGCKVLGAFIGSSEFIKNSLSNKMKAINSVANLLLKYPNSQARYFIHKYCFNEKINYWLRAQFPDDSKQFLEDFKKTQIALIASYHGYYDQERINSQPQVFSDLYKRVSFPIDDGGLALRDIDSVHLTAFISSMAASSKFLAKNFPLWIQTGIVDDVLKITSFNENTSPFITNQIMMCVQKVKSIVPNGHFEGLNHPASIINKLVELSNQKTTQLEPDDQSPDEYLGFYDPPFKHSSSQSALYQQLIHAKFGEFRKEKENLANTRNFERPHNQVYYRNLVSSINPTSGAWLLAGMSHPSFLLSPFEFAAAMCRRNTIVNTSIPTLNIHGVDNCLNYQCRCSGQTITIDPHGYHLSNCKMQGGAIRLHDNLVHILVMLLRALGLSVALEPLHVFSNVELNNERRPDERRPDLLIRNSPDGGPQTVIEVALSNFNSSSRRDNNKPEQVLDAIEYYKKRKYAKTAEENYLRLCIASFSTTGEIGLSFKKFLLQQIRLKLQLVDGEVKRSKLRKMMNHCVRHISASINRSASRNIFLKVTKMVNLARHTQQNFSSSTFCDPTSSSASYSPDELVQQLEFQIINQDVIQT